jgi:hypothetical protein
MMKAKPKQAVELEAELKRLSGLVRERRAQLERLEKCPNKDCPCRFVWRQVVEENLAQQMGKIGQHVRGKTPQRRKRAKADA